ncbi:MAG: hypothetical protein AVDCRST_MAG28-451, partial [uncultured Rubrobacteraceae bacterium]
GPRLLPDLIVRFNRRLVAGAPSPHRSQTRPAGLAGRLRGPHTSDPRPVAPLPRRARLLALRFRAPARVLPGPVLSEPVQPARASLGARDARVAAGLRRGAHRAFVGLSRPGHLSYTSDREGKSVPQGAVRWAGLLREERVEDRVGLWVQGGVGRGPARRGDRLRTCPGGLGRKTHRGRSRGLRPPRSVPGGQGLRGGRVGAALAEGVRSTGGGHPEEQRPPGLAEGGSPLGVGQAPDHRRGDRPAQGLLRSGASLCEDPRRAAGALGGQGRGVHLRSTDQRLPRQTAASPSGPVGL